MAQVTPDDSGVFISLRDIYDQLIRVSEDINELVSRMDSNKGVMADHEDRIRGLERWRYTLPTSMVLGLLSMGASIGSLMGAFR